MLHLLVSNFSKTSRYSFIVAVSMLRVVSLTDSYLSLYPPSEFSPSDIEVGVWGRDRLPVGVDRPDLFQDLNRVHEKRALPLPPKKAILRYMTDRKRERVVTKMGQIHFESIPKVIICKSKLVSQRASWQHCLKQSPCFTWDQRVYRRRRRYQRTSPTTAGAVWIVARACNKY